MSDSKWLINIHLEGNGMALVFATENGKLILKDEYEPSFYIVCNNPEEVRDILSRHPLVLDAKIEQKYPNLETKEKKPVVKITAQVQDFKKVIGDLKKVPGIIELAETSIPHHFRYMAERGITFFKPYEVTGQGRLKFEEGEKGAKMPKLKIAAISSANEKIPDNADVVFTFGGDEFLKGKKDIISNKLGCFSRNFIHIDLKQDMSHDIYDESETKDLMQLGKERLIRVMELSRITGAKPDIVPRITPGKLNTYLHMEAAKRNGYLVPDRKKEVEKPKSLRLLRSMDKGGTIFYPKPGIYKDVAKCDFASMYPNIIVRYNISPETIHCKDEEYIEVPESKWRICKGKGIIPQGIEKVLVRRLLLKKLKKAASGNEKKVYDLQQRALKNILVTCFGHLGFSNFVFSNVENKECVVLFGRHILERTKEIAEEMGLEVVYGMVDSIFVGNGSREKYGEFVRKVGEEFQIELELETIFRAIAFPSSSDGSGVANKYYGITYENEIECRGIALRHSDAPKLVKEFEEKAIREILNSKGITAAYGEYKTNLHERKFPLQHFAITKSLSKKEYRGNPPHVVARRKRPTNYGFVTYVYGIYGPTPIELAKENEIDLEKYGRLLADAGNELLMGI